jgi:nitrite reductase (NO-forming)
VVNITLTNLATNGRPHNIDFHAVTGQGGGAAGLTASPGETASIQIRLLYPGAFMYHCAFGDVPMHIAHGMYGMFIVDPESPLPEVAREWAIVQSEWYVGEPGADGVALYDSDAVLNEEPRYVTFNGRTDALIGDNTLAMNVGERARIYFVNEGLSLDSNFHPIGSQWDLVYPEAATHQANRAIRGSQSTLVVAGGGTVVELDALVPSTVILVDHALGRTFYKGAIGTIVISGDANPELFNVPGETPTTTAPAGDAAGSVANGQSVFAGTCAACHGSDAGGIDGLGKGLITNPFVLSLSDTELAAFISTGRPADDPANTTGIAMPPKGGNPALSSADLADLVAFLRSIG